MLTDSCAGISELTICLKFRHQLFEFQNLPKPTPWFHDTKMLLRKSQRGWKSLGCYSGLHHENQPKLTWPWKRLENRISRFLDNTFSPFLRLILGLNEMVMSSCWISLTIWRPILSYKSIPCPIHNSWILFPVCQNLGNSSMITMLDLLEVADNRSKRWGLLHRNLVILDFCRGLFVHHPGSIPLAIHKMRSTFTLVALTWSTAFGRTIELI